MDFIKKIVSTINYSQLVPAHILIALVILMGGANVLEYMHFSFELKLVLLLAPFTLFFQKKGVNSMRFAFFAFVFLLLYIILKIQCCYFFAFVFLILFTIESHFGRLNDTVLFLVVLLSPLSIYLFKVFGFPIRLELTRLAALTLGLFFNDVKSFGNLIIMGEQSFSVDPACMGLKMMNLGLVIQLFYIAYFSKLFKVQINFLWISLIMCIAFIVLLFSNFLRIVLLVILAFPPETFGHELVGVICLLIYFMLPMFFVSKAIMKNRKAKPEESFPKKVNSIIKYAVSGILILILTFLNIKRDEFKNTGTDRPLEYLSVEGYTKTCYKTDIYKFQSEKALVYVKASCQFYGADHNPLICWEGSGYEFNNVNVLKIDDEEIYYTKLTSPEKEVLYTAWWFDNGLDKSISQIEWRLNMIKGAEAYRLINVTTESLKELKIECDRLLQMNLFIACEKNRGCLKSPSDCHSRAMPDGRQECGNL